MGSGWRGLGRAWALLLGLGALGACVAQPVPGGYGTAAPSAAAVPPGPTGHRIAILAPLSGSSAEIGQSMLRAARLALQAGEGAPFDEKDTKGTAEGAAAATRSALEAGAGIIVGPLTGPETDVVAGLARPANVPVLSFTSDSSKAQPGVWSMGITPAQQVRALVRAVQATGKMRIGALLPRNAFGDALANGLLAAAQEASMPPPRIVRYQAGTAGLDGAIAELAGPPATPPGAPPGTPPVPPPVDALLLGTTAEATLAALPSLGKAGLGPDRVRLLGTALWAPAGARLAPLVGAWFAAPDPDKQRAFEQAFIARYGQPPRPLASIAFDAAAAAKVVTSPAGVNMTMLLNDRGFSGPNGVFILLPDGHVRRLLTLFEVGPSGPHPRPTPTM